VTKQLKEYTFSRWLPNKCRKAKVKLQREHALALNADQQVQNDLPLPHFMDVLHKQCTSHKRRAKL
jgi:hypothetical protein